MRLVRQLRRSRWRGHRKQANRDHLRMANELQPEEGTTEVDEVVQPAVAEIPEQELPETDLTAPGKRPSGPFRVGDRVQLTAGKGRHSTLVLEANRDSKPPKGGIVHTHLLSAEEGRVGTRSE